MTNNASLTQFEWTRLLGNSHSEVANALTTGLDGSIYIAGEARGDLDLDGQQKQGGDDAFISKFNPDGTKEWTRILGSSAWEVANALTTGSDGSIYIAGNTRGDLDGQTHNGGGVDAFISKFNPDGTKKWTRLLGTSRNDRGNALTTGSDGSIYIAGTLDSDLPGDIGGSFGDAFISKFNADGTKEWTRLVGISSAEEANALTTGIDGSIYIAGYTEGNNEMKLRNYPYGSYDVFISKFNPDGTKEWTRILGSSRDDRGNALTTGLDGSIYISGWTDGNLDGQTHFHGNNFINDKDAFISKFNADGTKEWTRLLGSNGPDYARALTTGSDGSIYIAGDTSGDLEGQINKGLTDAFISKFNPDGTREWIRLLGSTPSELRPSDHRGGWEWAHAATTGIDGTIYFAGATYSSDFGGILEGQTPIGSRDVFISKLIDLDKSVVTISGTDSNDTLNGTTGNDNIKGGGGSDVIDGGAGNDTVTYTGKFNDYTLTKTTTTIQITDIRITSPDGVDTVKNIEYFQFLDQTVEESKVDVVKTYSGDFSDYKFFNRGNGVYEIETETGVFDDITGYPLLTFTGEESTSAFRDVSAIADIKATFDQVTGLNTDDAKMFRLYNASFKRLPDADGLKYWIGKYSSGENDSRAVASSFLVSAEFKERYGENVSDTIFVNTLYKNVLGRDADIGGLNYWLGQLNSGAETRYEVLLGFAESAENKTLFTEMTGFG